jgi:triphosphoribosyl-dephospho-CoA synthase
MRSPTENATLALLLEAAAAPTPGNVDRSRDHPDLRFEQFLAGAVGANEGIAKAAAGEPVGAAFEQAVAGMGTSAGENTQFGALLLLIPLVRTAGEGPLTAENVQEVVDTTTVADAAAFYRAFEHVDVRVDDPPDDFSDLDVRRGKAAIPALEARDLTLLDVLAASADRDGVAREWTVGFERSMAIAEQLRAEDGAAPVEAGVQTPRTAVADWIARTDRLLERAARTHLWVLGTALDSLVATAHDEATARSVRDRARALLPDETTPPPTVEDREAFAQRLVEREINPGMTADLLAAGLFVALERDEVAI